MRKNKTARRPSPPSEEKKLVVYMTAGYPDFKTCLKTAVEAVKNGADIIELGVPFSDPIADGKTIQASSFLALKKSFKDAKTHIKKILHLSREISRRTAVQEIYIMSYLNPILSYGIPRLEEESRRIGIKGFIIPDLTCEESVKLKNNGFNLPSNLVFMAAPNISLKDTQRLEKIASESHGFIYAVSLLGVTGARKKLNIPVKFLTTLRRICHKKGKKVYAGFGVSSPSSARRIARYTDGVIIGSAIIDIINKSGKNNAPAAVGRFCAKVKRSLL